jgi:hypothetical protein
VGVSSTFENAVITAVDSITFDSTVWLTMCQINQQGLCPPSSQFIEMGVCRDGSSNGAPDCPTESAYAAFDGTLFWSTPINADGSVHSYVMISSADPSAPCWAGTSPPCWTFYYGTPTNWASHAVAQISAAYSIWGTTVSAGGEVVVSPSFGLDSTQATGTFDHGQASPMGEDASGNWYLWNPIPPSGYTIHYGCGYGWGAGQCLNGANYAQAEWSWNKA